MNEMELQKIVVGVGDRAMEALEMTLREMTEEERVLIRSIVDDHKRLDAVVAEDEPDERLWKSLVAVCKLERGATYVGNRLKPIIGRILIVLQKHPHLYQGLGYQTYEEFMARGMSDLFGISRTEAYACRRVAERFPSLTIGQFRQIGVAKLYTLAALTKEGDPHSEALIEMAQDPKVTKSDLREKAAELMGLPAGATQMVTLSIDVTKDTLARWKAFCSDPAVQLYCAATTGEEPTQQRILLCMLDECEGEWIRRGHEIRNRMDLVVEASGQ